MTGAATDTLLTVSRLTRRFGGVAACDGVDFTITHGERVALIGPNGAGKTTLFHLLSGLIRPDAGTITLAGRDITRLTPPARLRAGLARTFQIARGFDSLDLIDNVALAVSAARPGWRGWHPLRPPAAADRAEALRLLARLQLADWRESPVATLPYGLRKRLDLAIALAGRPKLLLLDEPMAGVALDERDQLMALARDAMAGPDRALLFTEHDMEVVFGHATRVLVLEHGRLLADGTPDDIRANPAVQAIYLGHGPAGATA